MNFNNKKTRLCAIALFIYYIIVLFFWGVWNRDSHATSTMKLDLFWGYNNPPEYIYRDNLLNIISFIPIGFLTGIISPKLRVLNALLVGLLVSLVIESSQLALKRGVFDVDDLFNNTMGALIGGTIVWFMATYGSWFKVSG